MMNQSLDSMKSAQTSDYAELLSLSTEASLRRWSRRVVSISGYTAAFAVMTAVLPVALLITFTRDILTRSHFGATRTWLLIHGILLCEVVGIAVSFVLWIAHHATLRTSAVRYQQRNFALQNWWGTTLAGIGIRLFNLRLVVEQPFERAERPILLLVRHASFMDALFPVLLVSNPHKILLRYVLKRELLWDPCLDIVGHRLPNYFVRRDGNETTREIGRVARLAESVPADEGVLVFPEGTRFSESRRQKLIEKFTRKGSADLLNQAQSMHYVLPPRASGVLGLLDKNPNLDAVYCTHAGLEGMLNFRALLSGELVGREIRVKFWRIPADEIPSGRKERVEWLNANWKKVDEFVGSYTNE